MSHANHNHALTTYLLLLTKLECFRLDFKHRQRSVDTQSTDTLFLFSFICIKLIYEPNKYLHTL